MYTDNIIHIAADAGKIMLENGGETYRVEQTISMICQAFGFKDVENFVTPTVIVLSITNKNSETITTVRRLKNRTVNLKKVALINDLSRNLYTNTLSMDDIKKELHYINNIPAYSSDASLISSTLTAGFFTLLFGGNLKDFFISCFIGLLITFIARLFDKYEVNNFFSNVCGGLISSSIAVIINHINPSFNVDTIIIGSIMLLVPGLVITNAIRDTLSGDLLSGISRSVEALIIAASIAIGTAIGFKVWIFILGGTL
ncbi:threonine/serine exporter family protein [Clostridium sp. ATCC 25772]|uniref:threonine/serine exporter family protein n=1 Tax=Clostridium sp. ATCC 25772 TaxID=1676991 RepID=UPI0007828050|nr:threonine/serine exporter family protein [Clostridium sp. ATCC 25772]